MSAMKNAFYGAHDELATYTRGERDDLARLAIASAGVGQAITACDVAGTVHARLQHRANDRPGGWTRPHLSACFVDERVRHVGHLDWNRGPIPHPAAS